ncbi:hypothetical protein BC827DRAFT_1380983 [Russula dissimulans]|nr:hypothetical protein BC827DRAFT_1380983 [Russula dissimulans]
MRWAAELDGLKEGKEWTGVDQGRTVCVLPDARLEATREKKGGRPSTKLGFHKADLEARVRAGDVCERGICAVIGVVFDSANVALQEGMRLQSERDVRISETPSPVFFCVRSVILTPVCGENAHHVVLPAGSLVSDSPSGHPYLILINAPLPGGCLLPAGVAYWQLRDVAPYLMVETIDNRMALNPLSATRKRRPSPGCPSVLVRLHLSLVIKRPITGTPDYLLRFFVFQARGIILSGRYAIPDPAGFP